MSQSQPAADSPTGESLAAALRSSFATLLEVAALLEPDEVGQPNMEGGWAPVSLLAHVGYWDDVQRRRMEAALAGEAIWVRPAESNDERAATDAARSWEEVLAEAEVARERLATLAASLDSETLQRDFAVGEQTLQPARLLTHMVQHTRSHTSDLFDFCGSMARWSRPALRAFLDHQHTLVMESIAGLTEEQILTTQTATGWSMRDELVHIMAYSDYTVRVLKGWPAVAPEAIAEFTVNDAQSEEAVNAALLAARADLNMIEIADWLATFHRRTLEQFDGFDDVALASVGDYGWGDPGPLSGFLFSMVHHQAEHAEALWKARP
jgi:uncharacterized damage-inducible protein DinB